MVRSKSTCWDVSPISSLKNRTRGGDTAWCTPLGRPAQCSTTLKKRNRWRWGPTGKRRMMPHMTPTRTPWQTAALPSQNRTLWVRTDWKRGLPIPCEKLNYVLSSLQFFLDSGIISWNYLRLILDPLLDWCINHSTIKPKTMVQHPHMIHYPASSTFSPFISCYICCSLRGIKL